MLVQSYPQEMQMNQNIIKGKKFELLTDVVNDGTYPHSPIGTLMMKKGSVGYIKTMGEFLQVIRIYEVHFFGVDAPVEIVGCRV